MTTSATSVQRSSVVACLNCGRRNRVPVAAEGIPRCGSCQTPLPWLTDAGDDDFDVVAGAADVPVLVDLWATWCGPCRMVAPGVERAAKELAGRLKAVKVDVDKAPGVAARFGAQSIPTLLVLDHGREVSRQIGAVPPDQLLRWIESALEKTTASSTGPTGG
ncbi:MAG: thioredoxin [Frankiales bacterium]|nr:thioredoxin [Frankiales bacterium]